MRAWSAARVACALGLGATASGCGRLSTFPSEPAQTPDELLASLPWVQVGDWIVTQPSSSAIVFLAALLSLGLGARCLRRPGGARRGWGLSLGIGGVGALCAGISYQAFAYELKARGLEVVLWTSWWEIAYMALTYAAAVALLMGVCATTLQAPARRRAGWVAGAGALAYAVVLLAGLLAPARALVSFEGLLVCLLPTSLAVLALTVRAVREGDALYVQVALGAVILAVAVGVHAAWAALGLTEALWERGVWFSENDAFHALMLVWLGWVGWRIEPLLPVQDAGGLRSADRVDV